MGVLSLDNFELGLSGTADLVSRVDDDVLEWFGAPDWAKDYAASNNTHLAANTYANQVASDPTLSDSTALEKMAANGATAQELHDAALNAGTVATDNGALEKAAHTTAGQIFDKGAKLISGAASKLPWIIGGVVALGVVTYAAVAATRTVPRTA